VCRARTAERALFAEAVRYMARATTFERGQHSCEPPAEREPSLALRGVAAWRGRLARPLGAAAWRSRFSEQTMTGASQSHPSTRIANGRLHSRGAVCVFVEPVAAKRQHTAADQKNDIVDHSERIGLSLFPALDIFGVDFHEHKIQNHEAEANAVYQRVVYQGPLRVVNVGGGAAGNDGASFSFMSNVISVSAVTMLRNNDL